MKKIGSIVTDKEGRDWIVISAVKKTFGGRLYQEAANVTETGSRGAFVAALYEEEADKK